MRNPGLFLFSPGWSKKCRWRGGKEGRRREEKGARVKGRGERGNRERGSN